MPRYDFECEHCGEKFEEFAMMADRNNVKCKCGKVATQLITLGRTAVHVFEPMWYNDIAKDPIFISSKGQLKEECKKHDVISCRLL